MPPKRTKPSRISHRTPSSSHVYKERLMLTDSPGLRFLKYRKNKQGYWDNDMFSRQVTALLDTIEVLHPGHQIVLQVDWSAGHTKKMPRGCTFPLEIFILAATRRSSAWQLGRRCHIGPHGAPFSAASTKLVWSRPRENLIAVRKLSWESVSALRQYSLKVTKTIAPGATVERSIAAAMWSLESRYCLWREAKVRTCAS